MENQNEKKQQILSLTQKKHFKIWGLYLIGTPKKEIAGLLGTNYGHVYNVIKEYTANPLKQSNYENLIK